MSLQVQNGEAVHYPKRRDLFKFDDEVASIFDNMAPRSIPMYNEVHRLHVSLLRGKLCPGSVVVDVGSSTGHLFRNIERQFGKPLAETGIRAIAIDSSDAMMGRLRDEFPTVETIVGDICSLSRLPAPADVIFCLYTLQFVPDVLKDDAIFWIAENLHVGGYLVMGQKDKINAPSFDRDFSEEYYLFRRDNGYTQEEIDAKTAALKNSMWPIPFSQLRDRLGRVAIDTIETSRWLQFSTLLGVRRV